MMVVSNIHGVFPLLKPRKITSAQVLNRLKDRLLTESSGGTTHDGQNSIKMGHGGSLDSSATGVLAVGIGEGCKKLTCFLHGEKTYIAKCQLGVATDTYDSSGEITMEKSFDHVREKLIRGTLSQYLGRIKQVPPAYSALKKDGKRYSDWTKEGVILERKPRIVRCYDLTLTDFSPPFFTLHVVSGSGFYVRSLVNDLGKALGSCAYLSKLQRIKQGPLNLSDALEEKQWTVEDITSSIAKHQDSIDGYYKKYQLTRKLDKW